jgi:hypothetical protein
MYMEPRSYWDSFRGRRLEDHWLILSAEWALWGSFVVTGIVCVAGLWALSAGWLNS